MFKSNKGFTLVELIVVIAILAILAGVAIPVYNGYIKRAQDAAVVTELDAIATAAQAANATSGQITKIVVSADGTSIKVAGEGNKLASSFDSDFCLFYDNASDDSVDSIGVLDTKKAIDLGTATYVTGATWTEGKWQPGEDDVDPQTSGSSLGGTGTGTGTNTGTNTGTTTTHNWDAGTVTTAATCTTDGEITYRCTDDGCSETKTETIPASGHAFGTDGKCANDGCTETSDGDENYPTDEL